MRTPDLSAFEFDALLAHYGIVGHPTRLPLNGPPQTRYDRIDATPPALLLLFAQRDGDARWGAQLTAYLRAQVAPCLAWQTGKTGQTVMTIGDRTAALAMCSEGAQLASPEAAHCAAIGDALAHFHLAGRNASVEHANAIGPAWWRERAAALAGTLPAAETALLCEEIRFQALHRFHDLPRGLIVGLPSRANAWWSAGRPHFISCDRACTDLLLFDVALAVNDWCVDADGAIDPTRARALLHAYADARAFTALERGAWPVLLRAAALQTWLLQREDASVCEAAITRLRRSARSDAEAHRVWPSISVRSSACA